MFSCLSRLGGNMDWMYRGGKPDTEEFLLGKSVDKMVSEATTTTTEEGMDIHHIYIYIMT